VADEADVADVADDDAGADAPGADPGCRSITAVEPPALLPEPGRIGPLRLLLAFCVPPLRFTWPEAATFMAVLMVAASRAE
jgi:hypothetical protein